MKKRIISSISLIIVICLFITGAGMPAGKTASIKDFFKHKKTVETEIQEQLSDGQNAQLYLDIKAEITVKNTYDIEVWLDGSEVGLVENGKYFTYLSDADQGNHTIAFYKKGNHDLCGEDDFIVSGNTTLHCIVKSDKDAIKIKKCEVENGLVGNALPVDDYFGMTLQEAKEQLSDAGFVNYSGVSFENKKNIVKTKKWTVVKQTANPGDTADKNDEIVLYCQKTENISIVDGKVFVDFSEDNAKRAATVALTNMICSDVLTEDNSAIDTSKIHSYTDFDGEYINTQYEGTWAEDDQNIWHAKSMSISSDKYESAKVSLDVSYDGENYNVSNVQGALKEKESDNVLELGADNVLTQRAVALAVAKNLIDGDREQAYENKQAKIRAAEEKQRRVEAEKKAAEEEQQRIEAEQRAAEEAQKQAQEAAKAINSETEDNSRTVYCTEKGECYHYKESCPNSNNTFSTTENRAKEVLHKRPCKKCVN